jgi:hypothetical protein
MLKCELRDPDVVLNEERPLRAHHSLGAASDRNIERRREIVDVLNRNHLELNADAASSNSDATTAMPSGVEESSDRWMAFFAERCKVFSAAAPECGRPVGQLSGAIAPREACSQPRRETP